MDAPPSDASLARYLLGTADGADEERFDELSITDGAFAERLRAIEHDLADAYVRGELSPADRKRWEARYLVSRQGQEDLAVAEALAAREALVAQKPRTTSREAFWGAAAAVFLIAVVGGAILFERRQPTPVPLKPPAGPTAAAPAAAAPESRVVALTLTPMVRSLGELPTLTIPPGTTDVKLTLRLEPGGADSYTAVLRDAASSGALWDERGIPPAGLGAGRHIVFSVPARILRTQRYLVEVRNGSSPTHEIVATYVFAAVLQ